MEFDYIIVGAGSAGCVVANRLSADPDVTVLLLEAGPSDLEPVAGFKTRMPIGTVMLLPYRKYNWSYNFTGGEGLRNRAIPTHRGRVAGGSSSVNGMLYIRGTSRDYDDWKDAGNPGWGWEDVFPIFKKQENRERGADAFHGVGGELNVAPLRTLNPLTRAFIDAAEETQHPRNPDFNGPTQDGFNSWEVTQKNGQRWNAARAFLHPVLSRPNLTVFHRVDTLKVTTRGRRAVGVLVRRNGVEEEISARREVVLSSGAYNSAKLLMLSGIGEASELARHGLASVHHLPGVGKNLQDHPTAWLEYEDVSGRSAALNWRTLPRYAMATFSYLFARRGPLTSNAVEAGGFVRTDPSLDQPDIQYVFMPARRAPGQFMPKAHGVTLMPILLRPRSRGFMELASAAPADDPILHPNFLDDPQDVRAMVRGAQIGRQIMSAPAMARYRGRELNPGPDVNSFEQMEEFLRATVVTSFHPVGTCKMGPDSDPMAVVDARLRVRGMEGLRVVDSSIMPTVIGGNTNAPTMMIGEQGARFIRQDARR